MRRRKYQKGGNQEISDGKIDDPCEKCNNKKEYEIINDFIQQISEKISTKLKNISPEGIEVFSDIILKIVYVVTILSIFALIICLILYFNFKLTFLGGVSNVVSIISFVISIILLVSVLFKVIVSYVKSDKLLSNEEDNINVFILLIRTISISSYNLLFIIFLGLPFGFLLSLSSYLNPNFYINIINRFYNITLIIFILIIFIGLISKLVDEKIPQLSMHKINFFVTGLTMIIFIAIVNIFKFLSDVLLDSILTNNEENINELIDLSEETGNTISDNLIYNKKIQILTTVFTLEDLLTSDDKRGVISDNSYYLLFLFLYIIYILIIIILAFIFIKKKELINIKAYSKLVEEKVREFINKFLDVAKRKYLNNKE